MRSMLLHFVAFWSNGWINIMLPAFNFFCNRQNKTFFIKFSCQIGVETRTYLIPFKSLVCGNTKQVWDKRRGSSNVK